jgi:predicted protein tyrosine phosphatase
MIKILTVCRAGLVRSVSLADVLKLHFEPVDVIPVGCGSYEGGKFNSDEILDYLYNWADHIIVMEEHYKNKIPGKYLGKVLVCEVGADTYGSSKNPELLRKVWGWARINSEILGIREHLRRV